MNYIPNIRPRAEKDIWEAALYYEQRIEGLGKDFVLCVDAAINGILRAPLMYRKVYKEFRRCLVHRFPYGVFFMIIENEIVIFRVFHLKQSPDEIKYSLK